MRKLIVRRLHGDESGVTLVIVALCLVSLIGMIVLVVDVGGLLLNRRAMVNASDAAALSAAKSCILPPSMDPQTPEQAADALAADNSGAADVSNPSNILQSSGCDTADTGYVTVQYGANQQLFFAGLFGQGQGHVTTQATAIWGPAGSVNPMPIVIYQEFVPELRVRRHRPDQDVLRLGRQQQRQQRTELVRSARPSDRQPVPVRLELGSRRRRARIPVARSTSGSPTTQTRRSVICRSTIPTRPTCAARAVTGRARGTTSPS